MNHPDNPGAPGACPSAPSAPPATATPPAPLYSRPRKTFLLGRLLLSWILGNADRMAMSMSVVPIQNEFNLDARSAGLLLSAFYVS